ncbi:hypothetical protein PybrP1_001851 [[Pythium] brassicae (nom. inval.)]|nr:hypothetical protein PybrP1_001851 [[Pythium] brassicae (nom. inval.)]
MVDDAPSGGCHGFRCLDRDVCVTYCEQSKSATRAHESDSCEKVAADERASFRYRNSRGELLLLSTDEAQELMRCTFTSKLVFQSSAMLHNYAFWGFADCVVDGFEHIPAQEVCFSEVSRKVAIGHATALAEYEENPLGLFAVEDISSLTFLGEYTGVLQVRNDSANTFDPYGVSYPSVYQHGDLYVSASEYGNIIRCINHSFAPNACFVPMIQDGILHIFCVRAGAPFTIREIRAGEQVFVNYGPAYWKSTGIEPVAVQ